MHRNLVLILLVNVEITVTHALFVSRIGQFTFGELVYIVSLMRHCYQPVFLTFQNNFLGILTVVITACKMKACLRLRSEGIIRSNAPFYCFELAGRYLRSSLLTFRVEIRGG